MKSPSTTERAATATGRYQRSARNYLLDPRFQLKYTALLVAVALLLSGILGAQLWITSDAVLAQSQQTVEQGKQTVARGTQMLAESRKVSDVVAMNIDKEYADDPELAKLYREDTDKRAQMLVDEQRRLEQDAAKLEQQAAYLRGQQSKTLWVLFGGLTLLVLAIGVTGIVFTHKIAGPIHKMKRLLGDVGEGRLHLRGGLRKGDELQHFFDAFASMVESLRSRSDGEARRLEEAIAQLEGKVDEGSLAPLRSLQADIRARLDAS